MRELHGALILDWNRFALLRRDILLFDSIMADLFTLTPETLAPQQAYLLDDLHFLLERNIIVNCVDSATPIDSVGYLAASPLKAQTLGNGSTYFNLFGCDTEEEFHRFVDEHRELHNDIMSRYFSMAVNMAFSVETVPMCRMRLPTLFDDPEMLTKSPVDVIRIALDAFPVPDQTCSWEDILAFKAEAPRKGLGPSTMVALLDHKGAVGNRNQG